MTKASLISLWVALGLCMGETMAEDGDEAKLFERAERVIDTVRQAELRIALQGPGDKPLEGYKLKVRLVRHEFLFGAAIALRAGPVGAQEKAYRKAFASLFNYATTENIMKWKPLEPERGKYRWDRVDRTLDWCTSNGIELKSHCLIWGTRTQGVPDWLSGTTRADVLARMKEHIDVVMQRYRGRIRYYDVVNEPLHCHVFDRIAGADHLDKVMRYARNADPDAYLIINEYNLIARPAERKRFIALVRHLLAEGTPIDGIGIQAHSPGTTWHSPCAVVETLDDLAALGKDLHVTELTLKTEGEDITGGYRKGKWTEKAHAEYYRQLYTLCFGHPNVKAITMWAVFDSRSWLPGGGIFDRDGRPKAVAETVEKLIKKTWHTEKELRTDKQGTAGLRGFKGTYEVEVISPSGKSVMSTRLQLGPAASGEARIRVP